MSWRITASGPASLGLLDQYGGAAAAYSLRNLSIYNTSPVVRVRRSSDNTESDFTAAQVSDGSLAAWVGAGNNGFVRTWYDQSGNANHAQQATSGSQPQIVNNGSLVTVNSKPAASFSSANLLQTSSIVYKPLSLFFVGKRNITNDTFELLTTNPSVAGSMQVRAFTNARLQLVDRFNVLIGESTSSTTTNPESWNALYSGSGSFTFFLNNVAAGSGANNRTIVSATHQIGSGNALLSEWISYTFDQTASRAAIESNINSHYAIY
jgi:hypothetical protein